VRQESDARHQEKFDRDSPLSRIILERCADASRALGCASRRSDARRRPRAAARDAGARIPGGTRKTKMIERRDVRLRGAAERAAAVSRRSRDKRRRSLRLAFAERRAERAPVR
jgi:hypothetical protein